MREFPRLRSGVLVAWFAAWMNGSASSDDLLAATVGDDAPHVVADLDGNVVPLAQALVEFRRAATPLRLVLPVAGDVRGVPGPALFRASALEAGEAVVGDDIAFVPQIVEFYPSSAPTSVTWQAFRTEPAPPDPLSVVDAQQELATAIRDAASALAAADVAGRADVATELSGARRASEHLVLPPGHPPRAVALLAQAERLQAVLDIAARDPEGGAVDRMGMAARASGLRPLVVAVRRARLAGYNALSEVRAH
jgi:hypothetical protein